METKSGIERGPGLLRLTVSRPTDAPSGHHFRDTGEGDWSGTLDLLRNAADTMRAAHNRIGELEARYEEIVQLTVEQLKAAQKKMDDASERALAAEDRIRAADERSADDQQWLSQIESGLQELPRQAEALREVLCRELYYDVREARQYG